jgi:hypothetical protein
MAALSFLDRERTIAPATYNRWLIPPAALAIHLAIGQVYAFSVFKIPLSKLYGVVGAAAGGRRYDFTMYLMAGLLVIGFVCNLLVRPVDPKHYYVAARAGVPLEPDVPVPSMPTVVPPARAAH